MMPLLPLVLLLFLLGLPQPEARAESDGASVMNWRSSLPRVQSRTPRQTYKARRRYSTSQTRSVLSDSELGLHMPDSHLALPLPADELRTKIAVIGDSLAEALAFGFDADTPFKRDFLVRQKTISASGLVRDDFHNWPSATADLVRDHPDLKAVIVMLGLNDRQALRLGDQTLEALTPAWRQAYLGRVDALLAARPASVPVIWVGLPPVRLPRLSADLFEINGLIRERIQMAGQTYVDLVDAFADENGAFSPTGPDIIGDIVRLRGPDGVHFTPAGQRKLAYFVERALRRVIGERPQAVAARPELVRPEAREADPPAVVLPLPPSFGALPDPVYQGTLPIALPAPRPESGEVRVIGEARTARELLSPTPSLDRPELARRVFDRGLPQPPRAGRSDDYRWR